jgi:hypothetical protein
MSNGYMNPARNGGFFYLIFKISVGYVKSNIELQNLKLWQDWLNLLKSLFPITLLNMICLSYKEINNGNIFRNPVQNP